MLECRLSDGPTLSEDLGAYFFKSKAEMWSADVRNVPDKELQKFCNYLVLKLLASKLLCPEKASTELDGKPAVMLKWERKKGPRGKIMLAHRMMHCGGTFRHATNN
jgi:hypothetical protein